jgi:hypothetical protein
MIHITMFTFVQVAAAMTPAPGPEARSLLVTGTSEAAGDVAALISATRPVPASPRRWVWPGGQEAPAESRMTARPILLMLGE